MGCLSLLFNIIWICTGGWTIAVYWLVWALLFDITIVGIPLGRQALKMASLTLLPFGTTVTYGGGAPSVVANILWLVPGLIAAAAYAIGGLLLCVTIVGIPFGVQLFKMAKLALFPFGARVE